jgi:hypothetical protein
MMRSQQIISILDTVDPGLPIVKLVKKNSSNISTENMPWTCQIHEDTFISSLIKTNIKREVKFIGSDRGFYIDKSSTLSYIKQEVIDNFLNIAQQIIPGKEPRRTNLWRACKVIRRKASAVHFDGELFTTVFDLSDYYFSVTKEFDLKSETNKVHRNNLLHILKSMEQKYGR